MQAREFPCRHCFSWRFWDGTQGRSDLRGKVCPGCEFATRGREQYLALENLANMEAYLEYLGDPEAYLEYRTEYGYGDLEESP